MTDHWAIVEPVDVKSRVKIDGGRPLFAHFDAHLLPSDYHHEGIRIEYAFDCTDDERWCTAIEAGVAKFTQRRIEAGDPVCNTTLVMTRVIAHPIDTDEHAVAYNVALSLQIQFDKHAMEVNRDEE